MTFTLDNNTTFVILVVIGGVLLIASKYFDLKKKEHDREIMKLQLSVNIDREPIIKTLDEFIEEVFNDYISQHVKYINMVYISNDMQKTIITDLVDMVSERMSPYLYQRLSLIYNEKAIPEVLSNKIVMMVTLFSSDKNTVKPKDEQVNLDL